MQVYCPNCGTENEGLEGGRVTCKACTASFEVRAPTQMPAPAPAPPPVTSPPPGTGWVGSSGPSAPLQPGTVSSMGQPGAPGGTNTLAIVSLISGIVCCIPLVSPAVAIICGVIAMKQIDESGGTQGGKGLAIAGIALGALTVLGNVLYLIGVIMQVASQQ